MSRQECRARRPSEQDLQALRVPQRPRWQPEDRDTAGRAPISHLRRRSDRQRLRQRCVDLRDRAVVPGAVEPHRDVHVDGLNLLYGLLDRRRRRRHRFRGRGGDRGCRRVWERLRGFNRQLRGGRGGRLDRLGRNLLDRSRRCRVRGRHGFRLRRHGRRSRRYDRRRCGESRHRRRCNDRLRGGHGCGDDGLWIGQPGKRGHGWGFRDRWGSKRRGSPEHRHPDGDPAMRCAQRYCPHVIRNTQT